MWEWPQNSTAVDVLHTSVCVLKERRRMLSSQTREVNHEESIDLGPLGICAQTDISRPLGSTVDPAEPQVKRKDWKGWNQGLVITKDTETVTKKRKLLEDIKCTNKPRATADCKREQQHCRCTNCPQLMNVLNIILTTRGEIRSTL